MQHKDILNFWFKELTPADWFRKNPVLDQEIKERFQSVLQQASKGELRHWRETPEGRLAEIIVLDQFSRNIYRNSKRAFANDELALKLAQEMVASGLDQELPKEMRSFVYMPYMHSEKIEIHYDAEKLFEAAGLDEGLDYERRHRYIIQKFGRYPHRNKILGRKSTPEEIQFLKEPDSSF